MLVDQVGEVLITNDGATILKRLDVEHPAGKVLVELAELQDKEVSSKNLLFNEKRKSCTNKNTKKIGR